VHGLPCSVFFVLTWGGGVEGGGGVSREGQLLRFDLSLLYSLSSNGVHA
jgi:hypothetical protein